MPRQARIDAPGAFHHIICRGLERRKIFWDDIDRDNFVSRLGNVLDRTSTRCFAWALIPNHFHLLLQTGNVPIAEVMSRLLTGYAVVFNHRHNRVGHVFQNRYKSILCQAEQYLLELVRYIHLNPLRAGIVSTTAALSQYRYSGHGPLTGTFQEAWQDIDEVLLRFSASKKEGLEKYVAFVSEGIAAGKRPELTGGGLIRSARGWQSVINARRERQLFHSDERILGDSDFVEMALNAAKERLTKQQAYQSDGIEFEQVTQRAADLLRIDTNELLVGGKRACAVLARSLVCYWATREIGIPGSVVAKNLGLSESAVCRAARRGELLAREKG